MLKTFIVLAIAASSIAASPIAMAESANASAPGKIDEDLYSRQLYVLGHEAMRRMAKASILISGLGGLGVEIAKNVILSGVKSVTLHDTVACTLGDLSSQYYLSEGDVGKNRAEASLKQLSELNNYVTVNVHTGELTEEFIKKFTVVVLTETSNAEQDRIAVITHENNIPLIIGQTRGLFGKIFCDFGVNFTVYDDNGEQPITNMVDSITKDQEGIVTCIDRSLHGLETGQYITFSEVEGMTELNGHNPIQIKEIDAFSFSIGDTSQFGEYIRGGTFTQVKMSKNITFLPLAEAKKSPNYIFTDYAKLDRNDQYHLAFEALDEFVVKNGRLPTPWSESDATAFLNLETIRNAQLEVDEKLLKTFAKISAGEISAMNSIIGGTIAQEVLKACSGKFTPIQQYLYMDAIEALPENELTEEECKPIGSRYDKQIAIFGKTFQKILGNLRYFIVGAGAIGCEHLKNFAMAGIGGGAKGGILVTDMDMIEKSNLNRQFLFRPNDVKQSKSETAAKAIRAMNKDIKITAHKYRVGPETEHIYNDNFYEKLNGVANALDNLEARMYMDGRCFRSRRMLIDAGTEGARGNVQVVVPFLTQTYSDTPDAPEKGYASCTLKNFPSQIEHTLPWARDAFEGLFVKNAENLQSYLRDPDHFIEQKSKMRDDQLLDILVSLQADLFDQHPENFADCVKWARLLFEENYSNQIRQLLYNFPPNALLEDNATLFWSPPKRRPNPITFDVNDPMHLDYIFATANLRAEVFGLQQVRDRQVIADLVTKVEVPVFIPKDNVEIAATDEEEEEQQGNKNPNQDTNTDNLRIANLIVQLKSFDKKNVTIHPLDFEKDDDSNLHMDFVVACSNLRATNYGIEPADRHKSKLIAGKIIPAIATSTAVASGLACLEVYKHAQGHKSLELYKSTYFHFGLPVFSQFEPIAATKKKYNDVEFTRWDSIDVTGDITLAEFIEYLRDQHKLDITGIIYGSSMIYTSYMPKPERMNMKMTTLVESITRQEIDLTAKSLHFQITCVTLDGEDIEDVPDVRYILPKRRISKPKQKSNQN